MQATACATSSDNGIELRHATDLDSVWSTLIEIYAEVRADQLHQPHYSVERYGERLARHGAEPGWETVIGFDEDEPVGYTYVNTLQPDDRWWRRMTTPLPEGCTERSTMALKEIMLKVPWRGTGTARPIHDELLASRPEEQVSLLVNPLAGDQNVPVDRTAIHELLVTCMPAAGSPQELRKMGAPSTRCRISAGSLRRLRHQRRLSVHFTARRPWRQMLRVVRETKAWPFGSIQRRLQASCCVSDTRRTARTVIEPQEPTNAQDDPQR